MRIPLPRMLRQWRERLFQAREASVTSRWGLKFWAFFARRPALYHVVTALAVRALGALGHGKGRFRRLPLASGWTAARDLPAPAGETFMTLWADRQRGRRP